MKSIMMMSLAVAALALTGCKTEYKGEINVREAFTAKVIKGSKNVSAGTHAARLRFDSRGEKVVLEISKSGKNNNPQIQFNLRGSRIPNNGPFHLIGTRSGQAFDVVGDVRTETNQSRRQRDTQTCDTYVRERFCWRDSNGRSHCEWRDRRVVGRQEIEYYYETTTSDLRANLVVPADQRVLAEVDGHDSYSRRVVTYEGRCWY